ncbi:hypothetical protein D038_2590B, partial [Vibrio parahaemolyticus IDH02189]
SETSGCLSQM